MYIYSFCSRFLCVFKVFRCCFQVFFELRVESFAVELRTPQSIISIDPPSGAASSSAVDFLRADRHLRHRRLVTQVHQDVLGQPAHGSPTLQKGREGAPVSGNPPEWPVEFQDPS